MRTKFSELEPGDIFMDPWDAVALVMLRRLDAPVVDLDAPKSVELLCTDLKTKRKFSRSWNAEFYCNYLRPGERDVQMTRDNVGRG